MKYIATLNGKKYEIEIERVSDYQPLSHEQAVTQISTPAPVIATAPRVQAAPVAAPTPAPAAPKAAPVTAVGESEVVSPMPGSIFDIRVTPGQTVKFGQVIFVLEAMKMENEIVAPVDGVVQSVLVKKGDMVETEAVLAIIK